MADELKIDSTGGHKDSKIETIATEAWELSVPDSTSLESPLLVIPTVHPRGDRRIIRCAQVALDAGFRLHFLWLGSGEPSTDYRVRETLFSEPRNVFERIRMVPRISACAAKLGGQIWHIHDFYFLAEAKRWKRASGRSVLYDVHEYYSQYYAAKLPLPEFARRLISGWIERYQTTAAKKLGGANVVTEEMAIPFRVKGVPVSISPNYPMLSQFGELPSNAFEARRWSVLNIGTLSREYGTQLLVELAAKSLQRQLPFEFTVLKRFPSPNHEQEFNRLVASAGAPRNLKLVSTRPTHEMPDLLAGAGFGLSLLSFNGQNEFAIPSKIYEHIISGMVVVVTDRAAQSEFAKSFAVQVSEDGNNVDAILDQMICLAEDAGATEAKLVEHAKVARQRFTWEGAVEPGLRAMLLQLCGEVP